MFTAPQVSDFKTYFFRDFPYDTPPGGDLTKVQDQDIQNAINDAAFLNQGLFGTQADYFNAYLQLAAHFLVTNLRQSSQGIAGQATWLQAGKGAGNVNETFSIPQKILDNPAFAIYSMTRYGMKFLSLIWPKLVGPIFSAPGYTKP